MEPESILVRARERVRLDVFLTRRLAHLSRSRIQRHIARGDVLVNGQRVRPSHVLLGGETITVPALEARRPQVACEAVDVPVVYEDGDLLVVDKPAGLVMHPVGGEFRRTLLGALYRRMQERGEDPSELAIVHRLDRLTSGLVVVAKRLEARRVLGAGVEARALRRVYLAVATGSPPRARGSIDLHIRRDPARPTRMQALDAAALEEALRLGWKMPVSRSGYSDPRLDLRPRPARTHYAVLRRLQGATLLRLQLETGRTHQIRVHLQAVGIPLVGDPIYGARAGTPAASDATADLLQAAAEAIGRPALHASRLAFRHPRTGEMLRCRAPLPADMRSLVARLSLPGGG